MRAVSEEGCGGKWIRIQVSDLHIWDKVPTFASWFFHNSIRLKVKVRAELSGDSFLLKDLGSLRTLVR